MHSKTFYSLWSFCMRIESLWSWQPNGASAVSNEWKLRENQIKHRHTHTTFRTGKFLCIRWERKIIHLYIFLVFWSQRADFISKLKFCRKTNIVEEYQLTKTEWEKKRETTANEIAAKIENISFLDYNRNLYGFVGSSSEKKRIQKIYIY